MFYRLFFFFPSSGFPFFLHPYEWGMAWPDHCPTKRPELVPDRANSLCFVWLKPRYPACLLSFYLKWVRVVGCQFQVAFIRVWLEVCWLVSYLKVLLHRLDRDYLLCLRFVCLFRPVKKQQQYASPEEHQPPPSLSPSSFNQWFPSFWLTLVSPSSQSVVVQATTLVKILKPLLL